MAELLWWLWPEQPLRGINFLNTKMGKSLKELYQEGQEKIRLAAEKLKKAAENAKQKIDSLPTPKEIIQNGPLGNLPTPQQLIQNSAWSKFGQSAKQENGWATVSATVENKQPSAPAATNNAQPGPGENVRQNTDTAAFPVWGTALIIIGITSIVGGGLYYALKK